MRLSVRPGDPGYDPFRASRATVVFNGEPSTRAIFTADEETGELFYHPVDDDGRFIVDPDTRSIVERVDCGRVSIFFMPS